LVKNSAGKNEEEEKISLFKIIASDGYSPVKRLDSAGGVIGAEYIV
jgi:hypothetical protein